MFPSGSTTGEEVPASLMRPDPGRLVAGSTPTVAPTRHFPLNVAKSYGPVAGGATVPIGIRTPHPSLSVCEREVAHLRLKSGFTATTKDARSPPPEPGLWPRLAV